MAKTTRKRTRSETEPAKENGGEGKKKKDGTRETVESIVVAFILAFLFRAFEAEAFVIPTGSMAPTLMGRHKDITCPECGTEFTVGASEEMPKEVFNPEFRISHAYCHNCRKRIKITDAPVFKGDRILVVKFPFDFGDPDRFDVVVFKYPEEPKTNYIKRLIGLPGEKIMIFQGDVYNIEKDPKTGEDGPVRILRKRDPYKQDRLQILVFDNDRPAERLLKQGWPERWAAVTQDGDLSGIAGWSETDQSWKADAKERTFSLDKKTARNGKWHWVRYRNYVPSREDWRAAENGQDLAESPPFPQLITDYCGYNAIEGGRTWALHSQTIDFGQFWVGDLTVRFEVDVESVEKNGRFVVELTEGERRYRCRFDARTGQATILHNIPENRQEFEEKILATAETDFKGPGTYEITFANVDNRLALWVDGDLVEFGEKAEYEPYGGYRILQEPVEDDLIPVGIAAKNLSATISHMRLERDIYYRSEYINDSLNENASFQPSMRAEYNGSIDLQTLLHNPAEWYAQYSAHSGPAMFDRLNDDEFFMLGDNSPRSQDSRLWDNHRGDLHRHAVKRSALVGKAFFIYWPHGIPFMNNGRGYPVVYHRNPGGGKSEYPLYRAPFYPHVSRMRRIR